ncbi:uncharacterized protein F5891DRAFT_949808, partial [Suillus fuscotomentosus]
ARPTVDAAYIVITLTEKPLQDLDLRLLVEKSDMVGWLGPRRHVKASSKYCMNSIPHFTYIVCYNLILTRAVRNHRLRRAAQTR